MVASIGAVASPSQGVSYYERDGYYAKDDPDHRDASAWAGKGADDLGLKGPVDPDVFTAILEGRVPDGPQLGRRGKDGEIVHRPGRDLTPLRPEIRLARRAGGRRRPRCRRPRPGSETDARMGREKRHRDPDEGSGRRGNDPRRRSEGGDRQPSPTRPRAISTRSSIPTR